MNLPIPQHPTGPRHGTPSGRVYFVVCEHTDENDTPVDTTWNHRSLRLEQAVRLQQRLQRSPYTQGRFVLATQKDGRRAAL